MITHKGMKANNHIELTATQTENFINDAMLATAEAFDAIARGDGRTAARLARRAYYCAYRARYGVPESRPDNFPG